MRCQWPTQTSACFDPWKYNDLCPIVLQHNIVSLHLAEQGVQDTQMERVSTTHIYDCAILFCEFSAKNVVP